MLAWLMRWLRRAPAIGPGIDVSHHQGVIDWPAAYADLGHEAKPWVYVKATEGQNYVDPRFAENVRGADAAGFLVGAYHFARIDSGTEPVADARAEMRDFLRVREGRPLSLVPCLDLELGGFGRREPNYCWEWWSTAIQCLIEETGKRPLIYTGRWSLRWIFGASPPTHTSCPLWWAEYASEPAHAPEGWSPALWQHTCRGRVAGIRGRVDRNKTLCSPEKFRRHVRR